MIIKCPGCGRRFNLERRPPATFHCPKCAFTAPFSSILNESNSSDASISTQSEQISLNTNEGYNKTKVVSELAHAGHTSVVPTLQQQPQKAAFSVTFQGHPYAIIPLCFGNYELGRNSSDSKAKVKLTPDMKMSRIHAGMRTVKMEGQIVYQITTVRSDNPVYVNGNPIAKGKAYNLKHGDEVRMGDTIMIFRMM